MKSKTGAGLVLVGVFLLGAVTGAVSYSLYRSQVEASPPRPGSRWSSHDIVQELAQGLNLDASQKERLKGIIDQSRERYKVLSQQFRPQYEAIRSQTREEIRQILREDQKARFEEVMKGIDFRHKGRRRPPHR